MRALAAWSYRHRWMVLGLWLFALVGSNVLLGAIGTSYSNDFNLPNTESTRALQLLQSVAPKRSGDNEQIVIGTTGDVKVTDPAVKQQVEGMLARVQALPHVSSITSPYSTEGAVQVSSDGSVAFANVTFDQQTQDFTIPQSKTFVDAADTADGNGVTVGVAGQLAAQAEPPSVGGIGFGILTAGIVLFLVFGSLFAAAMPLASALVSLGTATAVIGLLSNAVGMPEFSGQLVLLIGLGVGVDYALFIVSRHRQAIEAGRTIEEAATLAIDTSGRAVLFAGAVVCIALLGMFALGLSFLNGLAIAASIGVLFTMVAALTLLPALLGFLGPKILSRRDRRKIAEGHGRTEMSGFWPRWAALVERRPVVYGLIAFLIIVAIATPFFKLRLGSSDQGNDPIGSTTRTAYDLLAEGFGPGFNGPLQITAEVSGDAQASTLRTLGGAIAKVPGVAKVAPPVMIPAADGKQIALIQVYPTSAPQDAATTDLIHTLREQVIPAQVAGSGVTIYVGGLTAIFADFSTVLTSKLPLFIGTVVLLSFLLLAVVLRSIVVPLKAAVMNLLSIGAAFGVLTAIFQWGWLGGLFGVSRTGPVEAFLPVMLFAILFGLSMDYEVFLVMRIHEEWLRSGNNAESVRKGLAATGRTITAAAAIMVVVFGSFVLGGQRIIKEFGLGLAAAILVDAIVIRSALVPSLMLLFDKANWWFPSWLERIVPHIHVEPEELPDGRGTPAEIDRDQNPSL
jgi:RND superfamily putative drug exporter